MRRGGGGEGRGRGGEGEGLLVTECPMPAGQ